MECQSADPKNRLISVKADKRFFCARINAGRVDHDTFRFEKVSYIGSHMGYLYKIQASYIGNKLLI
jgi:hypothetical protein